MHPPAPVRTLVRPRSLAVIAIAAGVAACGGAGAAEDPVALSRLGIASGSALAFVADGHRFVHVAPDGARALAVVADARTGAVRIQRLDSGESVELVPRRAPGGQGLLAQGRARFPADELGVSTVLTATATGVKEDLVLARRGDDRLELEWTLSASEGLRLERTAQGELLARDGSGAARFRIPAPFIRDATGRTSHQDVRYQLEGQRLRLVAERLETYAYPLTIDPSVVVTTTADFALGGNDEGGVTIGPDAVKRAGGSMLLGAWSSTTALPQNTDKAGVVAASGYLFVVGGQSNNTTLSTVRVAPITGNSVGAWATTSALPAARHSHGVVAYNGYLYSLGGTDGTSNFADVNVAKLNANGTVGPWSGTTALPSPRRSFGAVAYRGFLYVVGGSDGAPLTSVLRAELNADGSLGGWSAVSSLPVATELAPVVAWDGRLYLTGGSAAAPAANVSSAVVNGDGTLGTWSASTPLPEARNQHAAVVMRGHLYVVGGWSGTANLDSVRVAPLRSDGGVGRWRRANLLPTARRSSGAAGWGNALFSVGGLTNNSISEVAAATPGPNAAIAEWRSTTALPSARQFHTTAVWNGYVYVLGGCINDDVGCLGTNALDEVRYAAINADGTIGAWNATTPFTTPRWAHGTVAAGGFLYVIGGRDGANAYLDDVQYARINPNGTVGAWSTSNRTLPSARWRHQAIAANGFLYVIGGHDGGTGPSAFLSDVLSAPLASSGNLNAAFTATSALLTGRRSHSAAVHNGYLYVLGGSSSAGDLSSVEYAAINANGSLGTWTTATSLPVAQRSSFAHVAAGKLFLLGGFNGAFSSSGWSADLSANGAVGAWSGAMPLADPRAAHTSFAYNGAVYLMGGDTGSGFTADVSWAWLDEGSAIHAWTPTQGLLYPINDHGAAAWNGYLYVTGGHDGSGHRPYVQYAPVNPDGTVGAWAATTPFPLGRSGHATVAHNGFLYFIGGGTSTTRTSEVWYAPINANGTVGAWTQTTSFANGRTGHRAFVHQGRLYVLGGWDGTNRFNDVQFATLNADGTVGPFTATSSFTTGRSQLAVTVHDGRLFVLGGINATLTPARFEDVQVAAINANGTVGPFTTLTTRLPERMVGHATAVIDGWLYLIGGEVFGTRYLPQVWAAPFGPNGSLGGFSPRAQVPETKDAAAIVYGDRLYLAGGEFETGVYGDVRFSSLATAPARGEYSRLLDLGGAVTVDGVLVAGSAAQSGQVRLSYRTAPASGTFGATTQSGAVALGQSVPINQSSVRYLQLRFTLDDREAATNDPATAREVTDFTVSYSWAAAQIAFSSAPQTVFAGACSGALSVESRDSGGVAAPVGAATAVGLGSSSAAMLFFADPGCATGTTSVSIPGGGTTATFYFRDTVAGAPTITASTATLGSATQAQTVNPLAPSKVVVTTAAQTVPAGACSGAVTLQTQDTHGNVSAVAATTPVALTSSSSTLVFYATSACGTPVTSVSVAAGSTTTSFWFRDDTAGTPVVTAAPAGLTAANQTETIQSGAAAALLFTSSAQSVVAGACSGAATLQFRDAFGNAASLAAGTAINLAGTSPTMTFFSGAGCAGPTASLAVSAGATGATFYFRDTTAGAVDVTATSGAFAPATQQQTIQPAAAAAIAFITTAQPVAAGACSAAISVQSRDAFGNASPAAAVTGLNVTSTSAPALFFSDAACVNGATAHAIAAGASTATFYFRDPQAGTPTVSVAASGWMPLSQQQTVTPAAASTLVLAGFPSPIGVGAQGAFTVTARDAFGNQATGYQGSVAFASTDAMASLPPPYTFSPADTGQHAFVATLMTVGTQSLSVADGPNGLSGQQANIVVEAGAAVALEVTGIASPTTAGAPLDVAVRALDAMGNTSTRYAGTVRFTSSDPSASLPPDAAFALADNGQKTVGGALILRTPGTHSVTVTDVSAPTVTGSQAGVVVRQAQGGACANATECSTGFCEQGVCCATACTGVCTACNLDGQQGTCAPVPNGAACSDGVYCNGAESCQGGACASGTAVACVDPLGEQVFTCDEASQSCVPAPQSPPEIREDALATAAVGVRWPYNGEGRIKAAGTRPLTFAKCGGPAELRVEPLTGEVSWTPSAQGVVTLCVSAQNAYGTDSYTFDVTVGSAPGQGPQASFVVAPAEGAAPLTSSFDGAPSTSDPSTPIAAWRWDFGDYSPPAFGVAPEHAYALPGGYQPELTVTDSVGRSSAAKEPLRVRDAQGQLPPTARIQASATTGQDSLTAQFSCACAEGDAPIVSYRWSFGPQRSDLATPEHSFAPGRYRVQLLVTDANGLTARDAIEVSVRGGANEPPYCRTFLAPPAGSGPLSTQHRSSFHDEDGQVTSQVLTTSDGATSAELNVDRTYDAPGVYPATLLVTDDAGLQCSDEVEVTVLGPNGEVPPRIVSLPSRLASCGAQWRYDEDGRATASGTGPIRWSLEAADGEPLPGRLTIDEATGALSWMPSGAGTRRFVVRAEGAAGSDVQQVEVTVECGEVRVLEVGCGCGATGGAGGALLALWAVLGRARRTKSRR